ncbi:ImuA family protein [Sphingomicrobium astaxanthinifaciens]|uniref:ImuA family protein n=1 Tax=Sphingomicrobium astaxanthinifaciens TaxID=1227949 RepID=UPI001FCAC60B|nr:recA-like protein [Sphingomicrobium astaxanthinifaciens]MCJ7421048.1 recA-like protein [Sphingomicrobium astaxanthinifaciens]
MADGPSIGADELLALLPPGAARGLVRPASDLSPGEGAARAGAHIPLPRTPTLSEIFPTHARDAGWTRLLLASATPDRPLLWVQERMAILEAGRLHPPGLGDLGRPDRLIHVCARDTRALLWTMEEGLRCTGLAGVVGEAWGEPPALDFTATRRLALAAEAHGQPCWLVRLGARQADLSGARWRWRVESRPSEPNRYDAKAPGRSRLALELFRARGVPPGRWEWVDAEGSQAHAGHLAPAPVDRALAQDRARAWRDAS